MVISKKRRIDFLKIPETEINTYLEAVRTFFNEKWLCNVTGKHRLQKLWRRSDSLATIELISLGHAIETMKSIDLMWVKKCIQEIKQEDSNCLAHSSNYLPALCLHPQE